ncbi:MAG: fatty acid desaturase [Microcystis sp. M038S2]|uniref:beta-carotene hydroxylase n=1 Tax=unclassified Microcystis TaxID=2643300 RepID=UPI001195D5BC|nr:MULTISPECIES: fatty acid desaturase [unclassified Microcystis]NCQ70857.1 beta-carotene hydroxylase [Microcystis aeruginosa W13-16]NCQ75401.1 beta-carotene hydroxylase [Microcystis aeruginosa W13-13]NCQ79853.1 beta-carotene hydroxylase [Microcystis aeruginosa W13-15]NCR23232.1 beta-carotene hydroxylase [Microcystis aeruginosa L111-01]NCR45501.1 beta-carotene hydroxylase [Microcystis aeruginosa SX13-01]NCS45333.1 beta-carotene hydroxylase [Microcystis aeruginosa BS11-05]NCS53945.1 beta-caro
MQSAEMLLTVPKEYLKAPGGFNPNVTMFFSALSLITLSTCGYWLWSWPDWICFSANVLALHLSGTVIHDASHNSAHSNRTFNAILGHGSALMLGFAFPVFTRVHLQHHAHVNDPENDPDHFVSTGGPLWMIAARFFYHEIFFFKRQLWRKYELLEWFLSRLFVATIVIVACQYGFIGYVMNFWFVPALVVGIALGLFFDYLPHRPFQERNRWKNARVYPSPLLNLLILGQNYHLVHHLWPSIPWYKYQPAYYATKPLLDAKNCEQSLGLLQGKNFWSFLYDVFLGIRFHSHSSKSSS